MLVRIVAAVAAVSIVGIGLISLALLSAYRNVDELRADKMHLESELAAERETVARLSREKTTLESDLAAERETTAELRQENTGLESELAELRRYTGGLESDLDAARETIEGLRQKKAALEADLAASRKTVADLSEEKATLESDLTAERRTIAELSEEKATLESDLVRAGESIGQLQQEKTVLESEVAAGRESIADLRQEKAGLESELAMDRETIEQLREDTRGLRLDLATSNATIDGLRRTKTALESDLAAGRRTIAELHQGKGLLESELASVREENQFLGYRFQGSEAVSALLYRERASLRTYRAGFYCTGSMNPTVTCLDDSIYTTSFRPGDIVSGSIISVQRTDECWYRRSTTHRVIDVKIENGTYYYWLKGDNSRLADQCWISHSNVNGLMVKVYRNVSPQNAELRQKVQDAYAARDAAEAAVLKAKQDYDDYCDKWATDSDPGQCLVRSDKYAGAVALYEKWEAANDHFKDVMVPYARCWQDAAANAVYSNRFDPPTYTPCER